MTIMTPLNKILLILLIDVIYIYSAAIVFNLNIYFLLMGNIAAAFMIFFSSLLFDETYENCERV